MKKIIFAIAIIATMTFSASAQSDGFFRSSSYDNYDNRTDPGISDIIIPNHFGNTDGDAPLGTGLLILTALGAGYAVARKKRK